MALALFAGIHVSNYAESVAWYTKLLGFEPSFIPNDIEAVWDVAEHRSIYIKVGAEHAGHALVTLFVDDGDLDDRVDAIVARGIEPVLRETYDNGVRKVVFSDPDGNEIGYGGMPA